MNKIKFIIAVFCITCLIPDLLSQEIEMSKNAVFFDLLGNGGLYSINYERVFGQGIHARIGYAKWQVTYLGVEEPMMQTFPVLITTVKGEKNGHLEFGGGFLFGSKKDEIESNNVIDITAFFGYRYQKPGNGFLFRIGVTPFISLTRANYPDKALASGGLSLGYHF